VPPRQLQAKPLTAEAFKRFGQVISVDAGTNAVTANQGTAQRFDWVADLKSTRANAKANLVVVRSEAKTLPFLARLVEKHPHSSQTFIPMACARYLVCVAPPKPDSSPDVEHLEAFLAVAGQGISYNAGTWHHPIAALDAPADFAMLVWEDGSKKDCVEFPLAQPIEIVEPA
jgi:ureidoglycolate lyase